MKECPTCHTQYDDSLNFCTKDGHQLNSIEISRVETPKQNKEQENRPRGNSECLKKIIIGCVIVVIGVITLYNYLNNAATYLRTEPSEIHASKAGGSCKVDVDFDGYLWTVNHKPDWVIINENDDNFTLKVSPNQTGQLREGSITIQSGKLLSQVLVVQKAYATVVRASETSIKFSKSGGQKNIIIETDGCNWEAIYTNWMNATKESDTELHITCPKNEGEYRTGIITVQEDNIRMNISVRQSGDCGNCHGNGEVTCSSCFGAGGMGFGMYYSSCMWCGGRGKVTCSSCNGKGVIE